MAFFPLFFLLKEVNNVAGLFLDKEWAREDFSGLFGFFFNSKQITHFEKS